MARRKDIDDNPWCVDADGNEVEDLNDKGEWGWDEGKEAQSRRKKSVRDRVPHLNVDDVRWGASPASSGYASASSRQSSASGNVGADLPALGARRDTSTADEAEERVIR
jgi:hypothetical protein